MELVIDKTPVGKKTPQKFASYQAKVIDHLEAPQPDSQVNRLGSLLVGESFSKVEPFDVNQSIGMATATMQQRREELRNAMASSVRQARKRYGGDFTIEVTDCKTARDNFYYVVIVTRTAA